MPFAGFENWADCMRKNAKRYPNKETRQKVCGKLQALHEKKHEIKLIKAEILEHRKFIKRQLIMLKKISEEKNGNK